MSTGEEIGLRMPLTGHLRGLILDDMGRDEFVNWRCRSKCSKLDPKFFDKLFFPSSGRVSNKAKSYCNDCPVMQQCLQDALETDADGIRAGTTLAERRLMGRWHGLKTGRVTRTNVVFS